MEANLWLSCPKRKMTKVYDFTYLEGFLRVLHYAKPVQTFGYVRTLLRVSELTDKLEHAVWTEKRDRFPNKDAI